MAIDVDVRKNEFESAPTAHIDAVWQRGFAAEGGPVILLEAIQVLMVAAGVRPPMGSLRGR